MYNRKSILAGIDKIKGNIRILEEAIEAERERIQEYYRIIDVLDEKERQAASIVVVEVTGDDSD